jgi:4-hydroxy-tetrahydrodipicolinate reductase
MKTRIILLGAGGRMGKAIYEATASHEECEIVAGVDIRAQECTLPFPVYSNINNVVESADVIIDFSHHSAVIEALDYAKKNRLAAVIATTGHNEDEVAYIEQSANEIPVFYSRNMSIGINLTIALAKKAASILGNSFDIEIIEEHHSKKLDAPSGTALMIADAIKDTLGKDTEYVYDRHMSRKERSKNEIGIHSVRGGSIVGEHEVVFAGKDEVIRIHHSAFSREVFAKGAISAALYIAKKEKGFYNMEDMLN